eukprot:TRINITY_DN3311_c1_g1_i1.p1 TRINITY_DN3311_c1_g1~~TRINITY_DN3311_c1_g1_i1.p1  ORF type:complete len:263 (+),score=108.31 TRINITY_DN3311_c1_g1_i1:96-791(+)
MASGKHVTATIALLKTNGGCDKLYKMAVNYCKLLILYGIAEKKGSADKMQKALSDARTVMRLGAWLDNQKKVQGVIAKGQYDLPSVLELLAAICAGTYKLLDNTKFLLGRGIAVPVDEKALVVRAKFYQFWQYVFGILSALLGKDGYFASVAAHKAALKAGSAADAAKAKAKATKSMLKAMHHGFDFLATLPNVGYVPVYKPTPSFVAGCGLASASIVSYLQYEEQLGKVK